MQEQIEKLLSDLCTACVAVQETIREDTTPEWRVAYQEVRDGYGWVKSDVVLVFAGKPESQPVADDSKDAGWANPFNPSFRDDTYDKPRKGCYSQCRLITFSAAAARSAGVTWDE